MCLYGTIRKNKRYESNSKNGGVIPTVSDIRAMAVPIGCGRCMECRKQNAREWHVRMLEEIKDNKNGKFVTLTFSNESIKELYEVVKRKGEYRGYEIDNEIATIAVGRWRERWRKQYKTSPRHWLITELGHKGTENVHMHGIVWTDQKNKDIDRHWGYGYTWTGYEDEWGNVENYVNGNTVSYMMKYVQKIDADHKEYKSKILTSSGIGAGYLNREDSKRHEFRGAETIQTYRTSSGHEIALPKYYRNKLWSDEEREKLWMHQLDKQVRYVGGEKVDIKDSEEEYYKLLEWYREKNTRLGYQTNVIDWNRKKYEEERRIYMLQSRIEPNAREWLAGYAPPDKEHRAITAIEWGLGKERQ
ncbi:MAG: replication initiator protein [Malazfec virus 5]